MRSERDITRIVRAWLEEGSQGMPNHVLQAVADQLPRSAQRRPLARIARHPGARPWLAVAGLGLIITLVLGSLVVGRPAPAPTPAPTPGPTLTPPPSIQPAWFGAVGGSSGYEPAVTYYFDFPVTTTFQVPPGWQYFDTTEEQSVITNADQTAAVLWVAPDGVYRDPCHWVQDPSSHQSIGPSVSDLTSALASLTRIQPTTPGATSLAGLPATELTLTPTVRASGCDEQQIQYWSLRRGNEYYCGNELRVDLNVLDVYALDVDGHRLMVVLWRTTDAPAVAADLQQILASIRFPQAEAASMGATSGPGG